MFECILDVNFCVLKKYFMFSIYENYMSSYRILEIFQNSSKSFILSSYYSLETRKGLILCYKTVNNEYNNGETIQI